MQRQTKAYFIFLMLFISSGASGQSTTGTDFWISFMQHVDQGDNTMVVMITSTVYTTGTVSMPRSTFSQDFEVFPNVVQLITVPSSAETRGSEQINDNALHVSSQNPISVYIHQYHGFRSEATIVLPTPALSNQYYVMSYTGIDAFNASGESEFIIVGIEDETTIDFTVSDHTQRGMEPGESKTITINRGQTYQVRARNSTDDLSGTFISGDKTFNVFSGASWSGVPRFCGTFDNLLEQMNPVDTWGSRYVTIPTQDNTRDVFRLLAATDQTTITVTDLSGVVDTYTVDRGEYVEYQKSTSTFIEADQPIMVAQYLTGRDCTANSEGDPSMVILNSVEQIKDTITLYNSSFQNISQNYISIIGKTNDTDNVSFDGSSIMDLGSSWTPIGLNQEFSYTVLRVGTGSHTIISQGCGVIASAFGLGDAESYAYAGGASFNKINASPIPDGECVGIPVSFDSGLPPARYNITWDVGHAGFSTGEHQFEYMYPEIEADYAVSVIIEDLCFDETEMQEKIIKISFQQEVDVAPDIPVICEGETLMLEAFDLANASFLWTGPEEYRSVEQVSSIENITPALSGEYQLVGTVFGCKTKAKSISVGIKPRPMPDLGQDSVICENDIDPTKLSAGDYAEYEWSTGSQQPILDVFQAGTYTVTITDEFNCMAADTLILLPQCPTAIYVPTAFSPNDDGTNDLFSVDAFDLISMEFFIYDRWGNIVFESESEDESWDGTYGNLPSAAGIYSWVLSYEGYDEEGQVIEDTVNGMIQLMR